MEFGIASVNRSFHEGQGQYIAHSAGDTRTHDTAAGHPLFIIAEQSLQDVEGVEYSKHAEPELTGATRHVTEVSKHPFWIWFCRRVASLCQKHLPELWALLPGMPQAAWPPEAWTGVFRVLAKFGKITMTVTPETSCTDNLRSCPGHTDAAYVPEYRTDD